MKKLILSLLLVVYSTSASTQEAMDPSCPWMTGYRVMCNYNSRMNYVMNCNQWISLVNQAATVGPEKFKDIIKSKLTPQDRHNPKRMYQLMFADDAANFVEEGKYQTPSSAISGAMEACNWSKSG